jgi:phosphatidylcholine synthase
MSFRGALYATGALLVLCDVAQFSDACFLPAQASVARIRAAFGAPLGREAEGKAAMTMQNKRLPVRNAAGFSVHVLTASGGAVALLALYAAIERDFSATFAWLGLAMFIDGIDGTLARAARVTETAATIDGTILDLIVDFLTYVVAPVVALWRSDLMPTAVAFWIGLIVTIASALYFADTRMKTEDNWFRGFPALWNVFVLYLFVFRLPWLVNAAAMLIAAALMFAPVVFVHPLRVLKMRVWTIAATIAWFVFATLSIWDNLAPGFWVKTGLVVTAIYFLGLPFLRHSPWAQDGVAD